MEILPLEVYSHASNYAVVRVPGRRFPGVVVQGDSLHHLYSLSEALLELCRTHEREQALETAVDLRDLLASYLVQYEAVLQQHNIALPYASSISGRWHPEAEDD